ncbi:AAA family ATPase, partial [Streptomyces sp. SM14]|uniref:AAA family ATPase n=1 Tax=Streptomyces sp. SM14 TaxID=1736045 RepID=UPI0015E17659
GELARLRAVMGADSGVRTVLVAGDQGVGKSRLLQEFERELVAAGTEVVGAHCAESAERAEPAGLPDHAVWLPAVCAVVSAGETGRRPRLEALPDAARDLLRRVAAAHTRGREPAGGIGRPAFQNAVCQALCADAATPLVLLLEDLHLADVPSLDLLRLVTRRPGEAPVRVIATLREDRVSSSAALRHTVAGLLQSDNVEYLRLTPLSTDETRALVHRMCDAPVPWDLVPNVHRATGGNPSLLTGLLKSRETREALVGPAWRVPFEVEVLLRHRLAEHPPEVGAVLESCAVIGPVVERRLLDAVLRLRGAAGSADDALRTGLITANPVDGNDLRFAQGLVRDLLLADLDASARARLHHLVARALASEAANGTRGVLLLPEIGFHCARAAGGLAPAEAVSPLVGLADAARRRLRHGEAHRWLTDAVAILRAHRPRGVCTSTELELRQRVARLATLSHGLGAAGAAPA